MAFLVMFQNPSLVTNLCLLIKIIELHKNVLVVLFLLSLFFFLLIANHTSNWQLSCQIQCINSSAQFMSCSLLSVFASTWVFLIGTLIRIIFITELYVSCMWLTFFFLSLACLYFLKKMKKKMIFLARFFFFSKVFDWF